MAFIKNVFNWLVNSLNEITKGILLLVWIGILSMTVFLCATDSVSKLFFSLSSSNDIKIAGYTFPRNEHQPQELLELFLNERKYGGNPPPIKSVIESLMKYPSYSWDERELKNESANDLKSWKVKQYNTLFKNIERRLYSIVNNNGTENGKIKFVNVVPSSFFVDYKQERAIEIKLPAIALQWVKNQRVRNQYKVNRSSLIDVFGLLMALGSFGSLIFLTRDYINTKKSVSIKAYIFRPILGMFLAVAIFIVDIAAHSIISTSGLLSIKHETIYLLAFAAGLLSEQAYLFVGQKAGGAFVTKEDSKNNKESSNTTQQTENKTT